MKERPILFSAPMVRAVLDGSKTQTRRAVRGTALAWLAPGMFSPAFVAASANRLCPFGEPGDCLYVREAFVERSGDLFYRADAEAEVGYAVTFGEPVPRWTPSIHMPRWASRIELEVEAVRVERLQEISEADAAAEGVSEEAADAELQIAEAMNQREPRPYAARFRLLWESLGGDWNANPWVWVVKFRPAAFPIWELLAQKTPERLR